MNYEQKYKEALETARKLYNEAKTLDYTQDMEDYETIFPELAESKDERIRKVLIDLFKIENFNGYSTLNGIDVDDVITWLEKQGKQASVIRWYDTSLTPEEMRELLVEWDSEDATWHEVAFYHADTKTFWDGERQVENVTRWCYIDDMFEKQGQQPKKTSIWKHWKDGIAGNGDGEQIYLTKVGNLYDISSCLGCECDYIELSELDNLLQGEQKSTWSEEDKIRLDRICKTLWKNRKGDTDEIYQQEQDVDWLKSLKDRVQPQNKWKPSKE